MAGTKYCQLTISSFTLLSTGEYYWCLRDVTGLSTFPLTVW